MQFSHFHSKKKLFCHFTMQFFHFIPKNRPEKIILSLFNVIFSLLSKAPSRNDLLLFFLKKMPQNKIILPFFNTILPFKILRASKWILELLFTENTTWLASLAKFGLNVSKFWSVFLHRTISNMWGWKIRLKVHSDAKNYKIPRSIK